MDRYVTFIVASLLLTGVISAGDWNSQSGKVGDEIFSVAFPNRVEMKEKPGEISLFSREGDKALYILTRPEPAIVKDHNQAVNRLLNFHSFPPKTLVSKKVSKVGSKTILDLESMNMKTRVKSKVRFVITPKNVWELKTVFDNASEQEHAKFISSFNLN